MPTANRSPRPTAILCVAIASLVLLSGTAVAQRKNETKEKTDTKDSLVRKLNQLQRKVAELEAALKQQHAGSSTSMSKMSGTSKMSDMSKMGGGKMKGMSMGGGSSSDMSGMSGMGGMGMMGSGGMGMGMMGRMKGMGQMQMASSLPGFPGASHIYHVGATSFFLDHSEHITLTAAQQTRLNRIKETALLTQSSYDRQIEEAEQQLWVLTSADSPDATAVEARVGEIAKLAAKKRIAFIRAVGEAAGVITDEQRKILIGYLPPDHASQNRTTGSDSDDHQH